MSLFLDLFVHLVFDLDRDSCTLGMFCSCCEFHVAPYCCAKWFHSSLYCWVVGRPFHCVLTDIIHELCWLKTHGCTIVHYVMHLNWARAFLGLTLCTLALRWALQALSLHLSLKFIDISVFYAYDLMICIVIHCTCHTLFMHFDSSFKVWKRTTQKTDAVPC